MQEIVVIGAGGIGSFLAEHLDNLIDSDQIDPKEYRFTFFDDDIVEHKNIMYQNFDPEDIDSKKTEALELKFLNLTFETDRIDEDKLKIKASRNDLDLSVLCADNNKIRREVYNIKKNYCIPFIDARANGKVVGIYSSDTRDYLSTLSKDEGNHSCQNPFQIAKNEIEFGNVVVAAMAAQHILDFIRRKKLPNDMMISL